MKSELVKRITIDVIEDKEILKQIKTSGEWELVGSTFPKNKAIYEKVLDVCTLTSISTSTNQRNNS